jgi:hypothetical protein
MSKRPRASALDLEPLRQRDRLAIGNPGKCLERARR